ncbi:MAG: hypothetical protein KGL39_35585 [Patescibacteria group bacterium]|nr:hypothetical protein [Patescibacteria group bacterium]
MPTTYGKLGCRPPRPERQARLLRLRNYLNSSLLPAPPPSTNHRAGIVWPMMANDTTGDCTIACVGHMIQEWTTLNGVSLVLTDQQVLATYSALTGYDPRQTQPDGSNPTDKGAVITDVLDAWRQSGIQGNQLGAYVSLGVTNHADVIEAVYLFGSIDCGVNLPAAWQGADVWDAPSRWHLFHRWAPGSWGGHCVPIVDYDAQYLYAVSWGQVVPVSYAAWDMYFSEAYALLDMAWFNGQKVAPNGFDLEALTADLQAVTG